jgi:hypothetical protein
MNQIKKLEFQRLINELRFVESDLDYQTEVFNIFDNEFLKRVESVLEKNPELRKNLIAESHTGGGDIEYNDSNSGSDNGDVVIKKRTIIDDDRVKKLYRSIVKNTHPDIIKNYPLNELYKKASSAYESGDLVSLYQIGSKLDINIEVTDEELDGIKEKIKSIKDRVSFFEKTWTWKWVNSDDAEKDKIILDYIKSQF